MKLLFPILCLLPRIRDKPRDPPINTSVRQALQPPISTQIQLSNSHPPPSITVPSSVYLIVDLMRTLPLPSITVPSSVYLTVYLMRTTHPPPSITVPSSVYLTLDLTGTHGRCHNTLSPLNSSFKWLQTANLFITTQIMRLNHRLKIPGLYEPEIYCFRCYLYSFTPNKSWLTVFILSHCSLQHHVTHFHILFSLPTKLPRITDWFLFFLCVRYLFFKGDIDILITYWSFA